MQFYQQSDGVMVQPPIFADDVPVNIEGDPNRVRGVCVPLQSHWCPLEVVVLPAEQLAGLPKYCLGGGEGGLVY